MFDAIFNLLNRAQSLNQDSAVAAMDKPENLERMVFLNAVDQMYEKGINADGEPMGNYSPYSVIVKRAEGQRYDHITGEDTGDMKRTLTATMQYNGDVIMRMDTVKDGEDISQSHWGKNIVGVTNENLINDMQPRFKDDIIKDTRTFLQG